MSFHQDFDQHSLWRRDFSRDLQRLTEWLSARDLLGPAVSERLDHLRLRLRDDKVMVAFVAEFSRGKSELINAVFFAEYGRRIMPASAGRTTMCPTELGFNADEPVSLRLLPIATRTHTRPLAEWRDHPAEWTSVELQVGNADRMAESLARVAEVDRVPPARAQELGFWLSDEGVDQSMIGEDGLVEVPRWRHAIINVPHPLLKQGLVILDTPGLNAIGAEPELTVSLLPQAHSVVFILGADTGVTQSDLKIWREHLLPSEGHQGNRLIVLNKIDTLWDELSSDEQVRSQIERQREHSAHILQIDSSRVLAVSAQKGLVAKINRDPRLLEASHLPELELALVQGIVDQRQALLTSSISDGLAELVGQVSRLTQTRGRDLTEQLQELDSLRGKNASVIRHMRARIEAEQHEFESGGSRIQAIRSVHLKLLRALYDVLGEAHVRQDVAHLVARLQEPGLKLGVKRVYGQTFERLRASIQQAEGLADEISQMLSASFSQLNAEFGLSLQVQARPDLAKYLTELNEIESSHVQYLGVSNVFRLSQPDFCERLGRALKGRLRVVYEAAVSDLELWNKSAASQLDAQLRDRRKNYVRRVEAVSRIQEAAGGLDERMSELAVQLTELDLQRQEFKQLADSLLQERREPAVQPAASGDREIFVDTQPTSLVA